MGATAVKIEGSTTVILLSTFLLHQCSDSRIWHGVHAVVAGITKQDDRPRRLTRKETRISYRMVGNKIAAHVAINASRCIRHEKHKLQSNRQ